MRVYIMKIKSVLINSLLFSITAASGIALADGNNLDQSRNTFVYGTIQGNWKPAATSVSNETPDVDKSLGAFASTVLGKTPRITPAVSDSKPVKTETASDLFTRKFQANYRYTKS
ncbi:hypothetical protein A7976_04270 [Methylobacillus sp. MM3]|nr:hypothetical protein A7976_04270 [Methylobacillus sp. MM3]